jgi:hypothetical protein
MRFYKFASLTFKYVGPYVEPLGFEGCPDCRVLRFLSVEHGYNGFPRI